MNKKLSQSLQDWSTASIHASYPPPTAFSRTKFILLYNELFNQTVSYAHQLQQKVFDLRKIQC